MHDVATPQEPQMLHLAGKGAGNPRLACPIRRPIRVWLLSLHLLNNTIYILYSLVHTKKVMLSIAFTRHLMSIPLNIIIWQM